MTTWSRTAVLNLYRALMRKGRHLEFTNKEFYFSRIRREFEQARNLEEESEKLQKLQV